jgi:hypothetical protein
MTPYLVTPPASLPVTLDAMKAHLRVVHDSDDADIAAKQAGAVAMLDGWGGVLGRCIMPQVWAVDVTGPGPHRLPFPDASDVAAEAGGDPLAVEVSRTALGPCVAVPGAAAGDAVTISASYALPAPRLAAAQTLIKLMVQREFDAMAGADFDAITRTVQALITALRWVRL